MDPSITTLAQLIAAVRPLRDSNRLLHDELQDKCASAQAESEAEQASIAQLESDNQQLRAKAEQLGKEVLVG